MDATGEQQSEIALALKRLRLNKVTGRMFWVSPPKQHPRLKGKEAGYPRSDGPIKLYWVIQINGRAWKRGYLVFFLTHGRFPSPCLDHKNGNSLDDRPQNLREATWQQNSWNVKTSKKSKDLPMGIRRLRQRYQARITKDNKMHYLGCYSTVKQARIVYLQKRIEFFGEFA